MTTGADKDLRQPSPALYSPHPSWQLPTYRRSHPPPGSQRNGCRHPMYPATMDTCIDHDDYMKPHRSGMSISSPCSTRSIGSTYHHINIHINYMRETNNPSSTYGHTHTQMRPSLNNQTEYSLYWPVAVPSSSPWWRPWRGRPGACGHTPHSVPCPLPTHSPPVGTSPYPSQGRPLGPCSEHTVLYSSSRLYELRTCIWMVSGRTSITPETCCIRARMLSAITVNVIVMRQFTLFQEVVIKEFNKQSPFQIY